LLAETPDSLTAWADRYLELAVTGVRSAEVTRKIVVHLERFRRFFQEAYGHDCISRCLPRDVVAWREALVQQGLASSTVNGHLASLSAFGSWVDAQVPHLFPTGNPVRGIGELGLPPLEPRALSHEQIRSLKNLCDRLERFHQCKGRQWVQGRSPLHANRRPLRDRAIVYVLLSTGLRRQELVRLDLAQLEPSSAAALRRAKRARIVGVKGKGRTQRTVFLSADARCALADYLQRERPKDAADDTDALFVTAARVAARKANGYLSLRALNSLLTQIGRWHDAEVEADRRIGPLGAHVLRHTFGFELAKATGADAYELERRLGHRSQRYIQRYTNPPEAVAAKYVEGM